jgi:hypothetical protein
MAQGQRDALAKYIYDVMVEKGFTSPEGHLFIDVFAEVWKDVADMEGEKEGSKVAQARFADLLRAAPQYFCIFRPSIQVAPQYGRYSCFTRKGEKMVRLVQEDEK